MFKLTSVLTMLNNYSDFNTLNVFYINYSNVISAGQLVAKWLFFFFWFVPDSSYETFYGAEDYPVAKPLKEPLYFEVDLMFSVDPKLELILQNCWASTSKERTSLPSWDLIVDTWVWTTVNHKYWSVFVLNTLTVCCSCENNEDTYVTIFHPTTNDARIPFPSHVKRFSIKMFTFTKEDEVLRDKVNVNAAFSQVLILSVLKGCVIVNHFELQLLHVKSRPEWINFPLRRSTFIAMQWFVTPVTAQTTPAGGSVCYLQVKEILV